MSKEAYYFSHDSNAHNDPKILKLLQFEGWAGYGLYWALVELLRNESNYRLKTQYGVYAFALRTEEERIKNVVENYELFIVESGYFFSESLIRRMEIKESKSKKARESALSRWNKNKRNANAMRTHSEGNAIKERKGKESKEKESKDIGAEIPPTQKREIPPSIEQVTDYCRERGNEVDPKRWIDHYTSNGWMVGRNKMKDWKAAVRTWEKNNLSSPQKKFKTKQDINNEIQEIGAVINERTKFNPYRTIEAGDSSGNVNQSCGALPE